MKHLAILISVMILKSCGNSKDVASIANTSDMITSDSISGMFTLEQLDDVDVTDELTLEFDSKTNTVSGFAGCNRFFGTYSTAGNTISFSELGATKMMCQEDANKTEQKMFQALAKINAFELQNGKLSLKNDEAILIRANENITSKFKQGQTIDITYRASTRGYFETIWIEGDSLKYTNDRDLKEIYRHQLSNDQLSEIIAIYEELDVESIPSLKPPSKTFHYDAAPMAVLIIKENGNTYMTNGFDHGNPPKPIHLIVNKVLSIKESMVKQ